MGQRPPEAGIQFIYPHQHLQYPMYRMYHLKHDAVVI